MEEILWNLLSERFPLCYNVSEQEVREPSGQEVKPDIQDFEHGEVSQLSDEPHVICCWLTTKKRKKKKKERRKRKKRKKRKRKKGRKEERKKGRKEERKKTQLRQGLCLSVSEGRTTKDEEPNGNF